MSGVTFALLRHAPTIWNEQGRLQGSANIHLSRSGRALASRWLLPAPYDQWRRIASPLVRARHTASLLKPAMDVAIEPRLHEVRFGAWEGGLLAKLEKRRRRGRLVPGAEPPPQLRRRLRDWAASVARHGEPVVAVTHKGVIRAMRRLAGARGDWNDYCLQVFVVTADGRIRLLRANVPLLVSP